MGKGKISKIAEQLFLFFRTEKVRTVHKSIRERGSRIKERTLITGTHFSTLPKRLSPGDTHVRGILQVMANESARVAYFRNFIFGVEDSLVSTVGLVSGIAIAGLPKEAIFATGVVLILVEAVSMAAGSFLSESSAEEYETHKDKASKRSVRAALVMLVSYGLSGLIPLLPYLYYPVSLAFKVSIGLSLVALAALGFISASVARVGYEKSIFKMVLVGGVAIVVGVLAGTYLKV
jgi:VIT1/CCC1 family predicted Fe2+/Mn2+ transporter